MNSNSIYKQRWAETVRIVNKHQKKTEEKIKIEDSTASYQTSAAPKEPDFLQELEKQKFFMLKQVHMLEMFQLGLNSTELSLLLYVYSRTYAARSSFTLNKMRERVTKELQREPKKHCWFGRFSESELCKVVACSKRVLRKTLLSLEYLQTIRQFGSKSVIDFDKKSKEHYIFIEFETDYRVWGEPEKVLNRTHA